MQQVLVVHGGNSFKIYEEFLNELRNKELTLERIRPGGDWKNALQESLGEEFDVLYPSFPNKQNAKHIEWKIMFEKVLEIADYDLLLVGHSLGGMFLIKYLSENKINKNIKGLFIVASPYAKSASEDRFAFTGDLDNITKTVKNIYFIYSKDDTVVDFGNLEKFKKELPAANYLVLDGRNHFFAPDSLPEIVNLIKAIK